MVDFVEARFEEFGWMSYLTTQYLVDENLLCVFFSNATLENADEKDEDLCHIVENQYFCNRCAYPSHSKGGG